MPCDTLHKDHSFTRMLYNRAHVVPELYDVNYKV